MVKYKIIGISGVARSGKDTLFKLIDQKVKDKISCVRYAFADELKLKLKDYIKNEYNIDVFNCNKIEKEQIRPLLRFYANFKRFKSNGQYWVNILKDKIKNDILNISKETWFFITDVRYETEFDLINHWDVKGINIHVSKMLSNGELLKPVDENEYKYDPYLLNKSDFSFTWPDSKDFSVLDKYVTDVIKFIEKN